MSSGYWTLAALNAAAPARLIKAGAVKLVAPGPLERGAAEVPAAPPRAVGKVFQGGPLIAVYISPDVAARQARITGRGLDQACRINTGRRHETHEGRTYF